MQPIRITAHIRSGFVTNDDYSPDLGSILEYCWLVERDLYTPNPSTDNVIVPELPIAQHTVGDEWLWAISSPVYSYALESVERCRKRWDSDQNYPVQWGKKRGNVQTDGGPYKSADLPVVVRLTDEVSWYAVGDMDEVDSLLKHCTGIGGRRAAGFGQVHRWDVSSVLQDWSLWRDGQLMTPIPQRLLPQPPTGCRIMRWNTKAPRWNKTNAELCFMPKGLVVQRPLNVLANQLR